MVQFIAALILFCSFSSLSGIEPSCSREINMDFLRVNKALRCLDQAISLASTIENEDERACIRSRLEGLQRDIEKCLEEKSFKKLRKICYCFYENSPEILAECSDSELRLKIASCLDVMIKESND